MKLRNGFVSNSSSASFVVRWSKRDCEDRAIRDANLEECLGLAFRGDGVTLNLCDGAQWIKEHTTQDGDGYFTTEDICSMFNGFEDFHPHLNALIVAIMMSDGKYKINETRIDDDGCW